MYARRFEAAVPRSPCVDPHPLTYRRSHMCTVVHMNSTDAPHAESALTRASDAPDLVLDSVLVDLRDRLHRTRRAALPEGLGWSRGTDPDYLADLIRTWQTSYDWRVHEDRIRHLPWQIVGESDDRLRLIHQRARTAEAPVVLLLHGWPDSILRFERLLKLLRDVTVVVPALPGFPFSAAPVGPGMSVTRMAHVIARAMHTLGYSRYVLSGGDVGGDVAEQLAARYPDRVSALHLTNLSPRRLPALDPTQLSETARDTLDAARAWNMTEGGYIAEQSTKPHSLAPALADSPVGLAAWIVEKLRAWSDCDGDIETVFTRDDLLTWLTAYWVTGTIGSSMSTYVERPDPVGAVATPTVMTMFARDIKPMTRSIVERFLNVVTWVEHPHGGHFAAWEQPELYADGLREALRHGSATR